MKRLLLFFAAFPGIFPSTLAQDDSKELARQYLEVAEMMIRETQAIDDARDVMAQAADLDTTFVKANFGAGVLHLQTIHKDRAAKYFLRVSRQEPDYAFNISYLIGHSYQYGMQFDRAIEYFNKYKARLAAQPNYSGPHKTDLKEVERRIQECINGKAYVAKPGNYRIEPLGREINSEFDDYAPVLNADETEIVFTSRRSDGNMNPNVFDDNKPYEDIFTSKKVNGQWQRARNIGPPVGTRSNESNLFFSGDGQTLYLYKDDDNDGSIYFSNRKPDGTWGEPELLPGSVNSSISVEESMSISPDGKTLYFSSDRKGGLGGLDIYVTTLDNSGRWSNVTNLGPKINTEFDDDGPFIHYDGKTLYFSSYGHKGMGGFDIYKTTYDEAAKSWSDPENMGYPINTPDDDIFFVSTRDGKRAYYSSVRPEGIGYADIYEIFVGEEKPKPAVTTPPVVKVMPMTFRVNVVDAATQQPLDATVKLTSGSTSVSGQRTGTGSYEFTISEKGAKDYKLSAEVQGYMFQNQSLRLDGASERAVTVTRKVPMSKLQVGFTSVLRNIYFDVNKATFKQASFDELGKLENMMKQNPAMKVEISGHTDNSGPTAFNKTLSQARADAVKKYLASKGVDASRVTAVGYGETKPLASNDDEIEGRELNRRVEFRVLNNP
jgi:outer membrane protein OmpA-like peptidoglycan-associated protein